MLPVLAWGYSCIFGDGGYGLGWGGTLVGYNLIEFHSPKLSFSSGKLIFVDWESVVILNDFQAQPGD